MLAMLSGAEACKRDWSACDFLHSKKRICLEHDRAKDPVYVSHQYAVPVAKNTKSFFRPSASLRLSCANVMPCGCLRGISHAGLRPSRSIRLAKMQDVAGVEEQAKTLDWNLAQLEAHSINGIGKLTLHLNILSVHNYVKNLTGHGKVTALS